MKNVTKLLLLASMLLAMMLAGCGGSSNEDKTAKETNEKSTESNTISEDIKIGVIASLSGPVAFYGQTATNGLKLAVKEINQNGGINGKMINLVIEDDKGDSAEAVTAFKKLTNLDKVDAIYGPIISTNCLAVAPLAQEAKVPMITPTGTNIKITDIGDYISRVCFIDPFQGSVMANFALNNLDAKTAVIFKDVNSDYSDGLSEEFVSLFTEKNGKVLEVVNYVAGDTDFSSQITKIKSLNADVVFIPGYYSEASLIVKQAKELQVKSTFLGADGWDNPALFEVAGEALNGSYICTHFSPENEEEVVQAFINNYFDEYMEDPNVFSSLGYDAANLLFDAIERAGSNNKEDIKNAINSTVDFKGVTGSITLDENRNPNKSAFVLEAKNGAFVYNTIVDPIK